MGRSAHSLSHFRRRRSVVFGTIKLYICASDVNLFLKALSASARPYIKRTGQQIRFSTSGNANFFLYIFSVCRILIKQRGYARFLLPTRALDVGEVQNKDYEVWNCRHRWRKDLELDMFVQERLLSHQGRRARGCASCEDIYKGRLYPETLVSIYLAIAYPEAVLEDAQIFDKERFLLPVRIVELQLG
jgi:hypothetical protein